MGTAYTLTAIANLTSGDDFDVTATCTAPGWWGTAAAATCPSPGTDFVLTGCEAVVCTRPDVSTLPEYTVAADGNLNRSTGPMGVTAVCADGYGTGAYPYGTVATVTPCTDHDTPFSVSGCAAQECSQSICQITQQVDPAWNVAAQAVAPVHVNETLCCVALENLCSQNHEAAGNHTQLSSDVGEAEGRLAMYNEPLYEGFQVSCGLGWALKPDTHDITIVSNFTGGIRAQCCYKKGCSAFACSKGSRLVDAADVLPFEDVDATQDTCCQTVENMCGGNLDTAQDFNDCRAWTSLALNPHTVFSSAGDSAEDRRLACCVLPEMDLMAMLAGVLFFGCAAGSGIMAVVGPKGGGDGGAALEASGEGGGPMAFANPLMAGADEEADEEAAEENPPEVETVMGEDGKPDWAATELKRKQAAEARRADKTGKKADKKADKKAGKKVKKADKKGGKKAKNGGVHNPMLAVEAEVTEAGAASPRTANPMLAAASGEPAAAGVGRAATGDMSVLVVQQAEEKLKMKDEKLALLEAELKALLNAHEDEGEQMASHTESLLSKATTADADARKWKASSENDKQTLAIGSADAKAVVEQAKKDVAVMIQESAERLAKLQTAEKQLATTKQKLEKMLKTTKRVAAESVAAEIEKTKNAAAATMVAQLDAANKVKIAEAKQQEEFQKVVNMEKHTEKIEAEVKKIKQAHKAEKQGTEGAVAEVEAGIAGSVAAKMQSLVEEARTAKQAQTEHDAAMKAVDEQAAQQVANANEAATTAKAEGAKATEEANAEAAKATEQMHAMETELLTLRQEHEQHQNSTKSEITEWSANQSRAELDLASKTEVAARLEASLAAKEVELTTDKVKTDKIVSAAAAAQAKLTTKLTKVTEHRAQLETELAKVKLDAQNAAAEAKQKYDQAQQEFKAALQAQVDAAAAAAIEAAKLLEEEKARSAAALEEEKATSAAALAEAKEAARLAGEKARLLVEKAMVLKKASDDKVIEKQKEMETAAAAFEGRLMAQRKQCDEEKEAALAELTGVMDAAAAAATAAAATAEKLLTDTTDAADQKLTDMKSAAVAAMKKAQDDATAAATAAEVAAATELQAANAAATKAAADAAKLLDDTTKSLETAAATAVADAAKLLAETTKSLETAGADAAKAAAAELKATNDAAAKAAADAAKLLADTTKSSDKLLADTEAAATATLKKASDDAAAAAKAAATAAAGVLKAANDTATKAAADAAKLLVDTTKSLEKAAADAAKAAAAELKGASDAAAMAVTEAAKAADAESKTKAMEAATELREFKKDYDSQVATLNQAIAEQSNLRDKAEAAIAGVNEKLENQKTIVKEQAEHGKNQLKKLEEKHASIAEKLKAKAAAGSGD